MKEPWCDEVKNPGYFHAMQRVLNNMGEAATRPREGGKDVGEMSHPLCLLMLQTLVQGPVPKVA